jgi:glycosyltransferase involved in cell wall biosynthesis
VSSRRFLSVVVSTLGRSKELVRLFKSLERQTEQHFEVIVVDQNPDFRVAEVLSERNWRFPLVQIRYQEVRGISVGRNIGLNASHADYIVFADDDCWYPEKLFEDVRRKFEEEGADIIGGRAADEAGRSINGRYERSDQKIDRLNVWTTSVEWMVFFRRYLLQDIGGFDETIGVGAKTPWQAAEGQDAILRAIEHGAECRYFVDLLGHHDELDTSSPSKATRHKARKYGRGMGFVLKKHRYRLSDILYWTARPSLGAVLSLVKGDVARARYYVHVVLGRFEGYYQWPLTSSRQG